MMYDVKSIDGKSKKITRLQLEQLRMLMDWQVRELNYSPESVTQLCMEADEAEETYRMSKRI